MELFTLAVICYLGITLAGGKDDSIINTAFVNENSKKQYDGY